MLTDFPNFSPADSAVSLLHSDIKDPTTIQRVATLPRENPSAQKLM